MENTLNNTPQNRAYKIEKHYKNKDTLALVKTLNYLGVLIDLIAILLFLTVFILMINAIKIPLTTNEMESPELVLKQFYRVAGLVYSAQSVNMIISIMAVFLVIGVAAWVTNFKHLRGLELYDYHRWEAGNRYAHAFMSLLTLNISSFIDRKSVV